jgi:hypothetical protein
MKRSVRVLLIAAALGLALPGVPVQPAAAGDPAILPCPIGSFGGNDGQPDCLIFEAGEDDRLSMGSIWRVTCPPKTGPVIS